MKIWRFFGASPHFEQAVCWLEGAEAVAGLNRGTSDKYAVVVAMAIHAIIEANDALTLRLLNETAHRHDNARTLFEEIVRKKLVNPEHASLKQTIQDAINDKARAEYKCTFFSKADFEILYRKAEKFLEITKHYL